jgi:hypothetical protein
LAAGAKNILGPKLWAIEIKTKKTTKPHGETKLVGAILERFKDDG